MPPVLAVIQHLCSSGSAVAGSDPVVVSILAGCDCDPAEEVLRERELEDELMLASDRPAPNLVPDLFEPQDAVSPVIHSIASA